MIGIMEDLLVEEQAKVNVDLEGLGTAIGVVPDEVKKFAPKNSRPNYGFSNTSNSKVPATERCQSISKEILDLLKRLEALRDRVRGSGAMASIDMPAGNDLGLHPVLDGIERRISDWKSVLTEVEGLV
jgi:hypothetical protein